MPGDPQGNRREDTAGRGRESYTAGIKGTVNLEWDYRRCLSIALIPYQIRNVKNKTTFKITTLFSFFASFLVF